jgi:arylsulfatase A-like enzyme
MKQKYNAGNNPSGEPNFKGVLEEYDRQMGRLLEGLKQLGIATNTLVLLTGDNGPLPTYDQRRTAGLRGSKLSLYEGGIRQPLLVWWLGHAPAGRVNEVTVFTTLDLFPTLCAMGGAAIPAELAGKLDGEDLGAALTGGSPVRRKPVFWEYGCNTNSFSYPKDPYHRSPNLAVRDGDWKLLIHADGTGAELFDLAADPKEQKNLAAEQPQTTKRLSDTALAWRRSLPTRPSQADQ